MSLDGLHTSNLRRQNDEPKCTIFGNIQNYFQESFLEDVRCETCSSVSSESTKSTLTVSRYLKETPSVLKIPFQRGTSDMNTGEAIKMN